MENLHEKIKELRKRLGLTQIEMARKLGVTMQGYRLWETGASGAKPENLEKIKKLMQEAQNVRLD